MNEVKYLDWSSSFIFLIDSSADIKFSVTLWSSLISLPCSLSTLFSALRLCISRWNSSNFLHVICCASVISLRSWLDLAPSVSSLYLSVSKIVSWELISLLIVIISLVVPSSFSISCTCPVSCNLRSWFCWCKAFLSRRIKFIECCMPSLSCWLWKCSL